MYNQARLKVLKCREDHILALLEEARLRLGEVIQDRSRYAKILKGLLGQGLYQLMEKKVTVRCKECDLLLVKVLPIFGHVRWNDLLISFH